MKKQSIWDKKIPNLLGLLLIIIGIGTTSFMVQKGIIFGGNAAKSEEPQNIKISNITDNSATITYTTADNFIGALSFGKNMMLGQTILDDMDKNTPQPHSIHIFTIKNLSPQSTYYFSITSGNGTFYSNSSNTPYALQTAQSLPARTSPRILLTGKVIMPNGESPPESIVYLQAKNSQLLSSLTDTAGIFRFSLDLLRDSEFLRYYPVTQGLTFDITVQGENLTSHATYDLEQTNTIPPITLSSNYDFRLSLNNQPISSESGNIGFPTFTSNPSPSNGVPQIITPKSGEGLTDQQPTFSGIAMPNQRVDIVIHSDLILQSHVTANADGTWSFRPTSPLPPGNHTISITTVDRLGVLKTIVQPFTVFAAGSQIFNAIPTVTTTPTSIPTNTPTPTPTVPQPSPTNSLPSPTISPTKAASPTATPTVVLSTPTPTPTPTLSPTPTTISVISPTAIPTQGPLPKTGNNSLVFFGIVSIFITSLGIVLFILTTKGII